jgi:hypothetical protein
MMTIKELIGTYCGESKPAPKFQLFDRTDNGEIVGVEWIDLETAWIKHRYPGWHYTVIDSEGDRAFIHETNLIECLN